VKQRTPGEIRIGRQVLTVLCRVLAVAMPQEGCALLLGERGEGGDGAGDRQEDLWRLLRIWPCRNVWHPASERTRRFAIDPREQLLAQKWARNHGLLVIGTAHSHPSSAPVPSATDLALAFGPSLMLILGVPVPGDHRLPDEPAACSGMELGCWWVSDPISGGSPDPHQLAWTMEN
jgi:[CysO sulfur-carrier protein]-S-L-cysteine hydrolase